MSFIGTVSGRKIDFLAPDVDEIDIEDIATGLAQVNRFCGQTEMPYSVAQHSVLCSLYCPDHAFVALMHDAPEAYMGDCPRPLKLLLGSAWKDIEYRLLEAIFTKYDLPIGDMPYVKNVDDRMLFTERRDIQPRHIPWPWRRNPYLWNITPWSAAKSKREFLKRFQYLEGQRNDSRRLVEVA